MAAETRLKTEPTPRGRVRFDLEPDGKTLSVHVDRNGFRRLLQTLERLAETGVDQRFERSGRGRAKSGGDGADQSGLSIAELIFHIDKGR